MTDRRWLHANVFLFAAFLALPLLAQPGDEKKKDFPFGGPKGFGPTNQRQKLVAQFDKDGDGRLNAEERQAARAFLKKERAGGKGGFRPGGPGGFGPGFFMAKPLLEALDTDHDDKLSQAELLAGVKKFFAGADKDGHGSIDEKQIADELQRVLPAPPGFPGGPKGFPGGGPPGGGPPGGFDPGKMLAGEILQRADANKDGKATLAELTTAAETVFKTIDKDKTGKLDAGTLAGGINQLLPGPGGGPKEFGGKQRDPAKPGPKVTAAEVQSYPDAKLYDTKILRTFFIEFENTKEWEAELADFYHTDVEVPATVTVDGKKYANVGIHFRGNSSYFMAPTGYKHSLNLSFDFVDPKQRLYGYKTTNLLNCAEDPTFMHSVLYCNLARQYIPAPRANFVKVVINGGSWGVYANQQQFNKDFLKENYQSTKGARWRVPGHPGASAGLAYIGANVADYKKSYQIKSKDNDKDWQALIELCRVLNKTPLDQLEQALKPMLDLEGVLWFLALDNATINDDGYWTRASDYSLYRDPKGRFHLCPYDTNETFTPQGGGFGGKGGFGKGPKDGKGPKEGKSKGGYALDPLVGLDNPRTPLYRLLAVPGLRVKYLDHLRTIAQDQFDWQKLKPVVDQYRALIEKEVELDTRKLTTLAEFKAALADMPDASASRYNLRAFAEGRRSYLLQHPEIKKLSASSNPLSK